MGILVDGHLVLITRVRNPRVSRRTEIYFGIRRADVVSQLHAESGRGLCKRAPREETTSCVEVKLSRRSIFGLGLVIAVAE